MCGWDVWGPADGTGFEARYRSLCLAAAQPRFCAVWRTVLQHAAIIASWTCDYPHCPYLSCSQLECLRITSGAPSDVDVMAQAPDTVRWPESTSAGPKQQVTLHHTGAAGVHHLPGPLRYPFLQDSSLQVSAVSHACWMETGPLPPSTTTPYLPNLLRLRAATKSQPASQRAGPQHHLTDPACFGELSQSRSGLLHLSS